MPRTDIEFEKPLWDVLVIGAGPAGSLAARETARRGMKTLLVESKSFPREKVCGGYVNGRALAILRSVGLGSLCHDLGGIPLSEIEIRSNRQQLRIPLPTGYAISRGRLDTALANQAVRAGVVFLPATKATVTPATATPASAGQYRQVQLTNRTGMPALVRAKIVVACDGLNHSSLRQLSLFQSRVASRARIGVGGIAKDTSANYPQGHVTMTIGRQGYVGITRVEGGQICVAAALDPAYVREFGMRDAVLRLFQDAGTPVSQALRQVTWHGTPMLTRHTPALAAERIFLVGDAAGYVEPFTGEGMAMAWTGALHVVPLVAQAATAWDRSFIEQWRRIYRNTIGKRLAICRTITSLARHPWAVRVTLGVLGTCPQLCRPIVGRINHAPFKLKAHAS